MKSIKSIFTVAAMSSMVLLNGCMSTTSSSNKPVSGLTEGAIVYTISNLHRDTGKNQLYAMNYQLPSVIPICSEFVITDIDEKVIELTHKGANYTYTWDKHTRKAGQSLNENFSLFFSNNCGVANAKINFLNDIDKRGVKRGKPEVGMSKEGILLAMGRPPIHATPDLGSQTWTYWVNRWSKDILEFDEKGILVNIID